MVLPFTFIAFEIAFGVPASAFLPIALNLNFRLHSIIKQKILFCSKIRSFNIKIEAMYRGFSGYDEQSEKIRTEPVDNGLYRQVENACYQTGP